MAKIIKVDGSEEILGDLSLESLRQTVAEGDIVEFIRFHDNSGRVLVIDEKGKLKRKPVNFVASQLVKNYIHLWDMIVGDAILCEKGEIF